MAKNDSFVPDLSFYVMRQKRGKFQHFVSMQNAQKSPLFLFLCSKTQKWEEKEPPETYFFLFLSQQESQNEIMEKILSCRLIQGLFSAVPVSAFVA